MKVLVALLLAVVSLASAWRSAHHRTDVPSFRLDMIQAIVEAHNGTIDQPESIKCDICKFALGKAYSIGCGKAGGIIADLCGDFAPLCAAALDELCKICETHCDVSSVIDKVCTDVHLC